MARGRPSTMQSLRAFALRLEDTDEGVACEGTSLESRTVRRGGKAFVFLRPRELRLKLGASLKDATARARREPDRWQVGTGGWVKVALDDADDPLDVLQRWIAESHALCAAKRPKKR